MDLKWTKYTALPYLGMCHIKWLEKHNQSTHETVANQSKQEITGRFKLIVCGYLHHWACELPTKLE
jgi:hypothetical protein